MSLEYYLDYNATSPMRESVALLMADHLKNDFLANPSSRHDLGVQARQEIERARFGVASAVGSHENEVFFMATGTEANNALIKGIVAPLSEKESPLVLAGSTDHSSVLEPSRSLLRNAWQYEEVPVLESGVIDVERLDQYLSKKPALVSIGYVNNETGVIQDIELLASLVKERSPRTIFHTDAVQALGKIAIDFSSLKDLGVDAMTISAHKIGGPIGAAALIVNQSVMLSPLINGGGQEQGLRSGTENTLAIIGFMRAIADSIEKLDSESKRLSSLQYSLENGLQAMGASIFGQQSPRVANTTFFSLPYVDGATLISVLNQDGFSLGSGSACSSEHKTVSHVLKAMQTVEPLAKGAVRVSTGYLTTSEVIFHFLNSVERYLKKFQRMSSVLLAS